MSGAPFTQDTANQLMQTKGFMGLVDECKANNHQLQSTAESALAHLRGQMGDAFQVHMGEIVQVCQQNNVLLDGITGSLSHGITTVGNQEEAGAALFRSAGLDFVH